jgi:hypothetical protein
MTKASPLTNNSLTVVLDLLSPSQIAAFAFGGYALFSDLHDRAQPKPIDRLVSKQLRTVNADTSNLEAALLRLAEYDPEKVLAVAAYLKGITHMLGAGDMAKRLEAAVESAKE